MTRLLLFTCTDRTENWIVPLENHWLRPGLHGNGIHYHDQRSFRNSPRPNLHTLKRVLPRPLSHLRHRYPCKRLHGPSNACLLANLFLRLDY